MSEIAAPDLLTVQQAIEIIDGVAVFPRRVSVPLDQSVGLRLAEELAADRDYPPFEKSLMDGYAVRSADVASGLADLRVVGEIPAGEWPLIGVGPGETMAIMTGAPLPLGADGVVPVEDVERRVPIGANVRVVRATQPQRFVAARGSDCRAGAIVLKSGIVMGPAQIAVAASIGAADVVCFARPRVAVLGTGDELVSVDQTPGPSQIRDSNTHMLVALLRQLGCEVAGVENVRDDRDLIRDAIRRGMQHDSLFITGGMSMGEYDYVPGLLAELGVQIKIAKLRIKPGKPFVFGDSAASARAENGGGFVFGLPGNPVSAFICTVRFAARLLARVAGGEPDERWITGRLASSVPATGSREFYQPAKIAVAPGRSSAAGELATITPLGWKGSADIFTLAGANALLVRAENDAALEKGAVVRVLAIE
jgi:molybdopterin molybdotransferase